MSETKAVIGKGFIYLCFAHLICFEILISQVVNRAEHECMMPPPPIIVPWT